jgi:hypothetical protein
MRQNRLSNGTKLGRETGSYSAYVP